MSTKYVLQIRRDTGELLTYEYNSKTARKRHLRELKTNPNNVSFKQFTAKDAGKK